MQECNTAQALKKCIDMKSNHFAVHLHCKCFIFQVFWGKVSHVI